MGYKRKLYVLKWPDDHELHGLEVTTKGLSTGKLFEMVSLGDQLQHEPDVKAKMRAANELFAGFATRLVAWNLEDDDDRPVPPAYALCKVSGAAGEPGEPCAKHAGDDAEPCEYEGVSDQDFDFMMDLIMQWMDAVASVDIPLPQPSPPGGTTETTPDMAASIPVETLSPSPQS